MRKSKLKSGENMLVVRVEHFVRLATFATVLTDKFYNDNENFNFKLTKRDAEDILKRGLFFNGNDGQYADGYFEASFEEGKRYNEIYSDAVEWVKSKYKWLA